MTSDSNTPTSSQPPIPPTQPQQQPQPQRQPQPQSPQPQPPTQTESQPYRHTVHKSYIWLGSLRALPAIIVAIVASAGSSIFALLFDEESGLVAHGMPANSGFIMLWVIGAIVLLIIAITALVLLIQW